MTTAPAIGSGAGDLAAGQSAAAGAARRAWLVAAVVTLPTFMEVLDTSIANVALRHIAGGLSAPENDSEWVITTYLAANAIVLPISGWLAATFGRRAYFLLSVAVFTASSGFCGMATSLGQLIAARVLQGLAGGGLQPCTQAVLLDTFPREKQGAAMTFFGVGVLIAPILGPTLGGWITDNYSWRWIFFINLPIGALAYLLCYLLLEDPPYLKAIRADRRSRPLVFDYVGLGLIALGLACLEVVLSKGQEWDWFGDPFWRVHALVALFCLALPAFITWELHHPAPVVDLRPMADRNFLASSVILFANYAVLFGALTSLPGMLQTLFGYDATHSGFVMSPSGIFALLMMPVIGRLLGRQTDARWLVIAGLVVVAAGNFWMARLNLFVSPGQLVWPRVVQTVGVSILFAPLNVAAYLYLPPAQRGSAAGLYSLLRNEGGSVGTSLAKTLLERREQFHAARLTDQLQTFDPNVSAWLQQAQQGFYQQTGDPVASRQMALQLLDNTRLQQTAALSYFDCFWAFAVLAIALVPLVFLMKRSVAEKGAHLAAE